MDFEEDDNEDNSEEDDVDDGDYDNVDEKLEENCISFQPYNRVSFAVLCV